MIKFKVEVAKDGMVKLFKDTTFDDFLLVQFELISAFKLQLDGQTRVESDAKTEAAESEPTLPFIRWADVRDMVYYSIKGKTAPTTMKMVFSLHPTATQSIFGRLSPEEAAAIHSFSFTIHYLNKEMTVTTGTNYRQFILSKYGEQYFDESIQKFFVKNQLSIQSC